MIPCPSLLVRSQFPPPVFDRLQYANTVGEAGEIWSRAVTSGRQRVDTQGAVPNRNKRNDIDHQLCECSDIQPLGG